MKRRLTDYHAWYTEQLKQTPCLACCSRPKFVSLNSKKAAQEEADKLRPEEEARDDDMGVSSSATGDAGHSPAVPSAAAL